MLTTHTLGSLSLIFTTPGASDYFVDRQQGDIDWAVDEEYVPLRASSGARLSYSNEREGDLTLAILCLGATYDDAKAARAAIDTELIAAKNGTLVTYVEQDEDETTARTVRIIGGELREVGALPGRAQHYGLQGVYVAGAVVLLKVSRN